MKNLLIITGPTATGKSELCVKIAKTIKGTIINCDSKQIYKEIPIITAQPISWYNEIEHKLYGYIPAKKHYSVGLWLEDLQLIMNNIHHQNQQPILTGGSGLYIYSLIYGLSPIPTIDISIREYAQKLLKSMGNENFYNLLIKKDPLLINIINPNNSHKLLRAFEIITQTKISILTWQQKTRKPIFNSKVKIYIILPPREQIYQTINERCKNMLNSGAIEEVENLLSLNLPDYLPAMKSHGIPEIIQYLQNKISLNKALDIFQQNTRNYAKRQYTWFKNQFPNASFFDNSDQLINNIIQDYKDL